MHSHEAKSNLDFEIQPLDETSNLKSPSEPNKPKKELKKLLLLIYLYFLQGIPVGNVWLK